MIEARPRRPAARAPASTTTTRTATAARSGPGLAELFPVADEQLPLRDIKDRLLFAEALETAKCFEEGVIESSAAANIGSIMGIGFPPMTGGAAQFMAGYQDPATPTARSGWRRSSTRADELAAAYGARFEATPWLRDLAATGGSFPALTHPTQPLTRPVLNGRVGAVQADSNQGWCRSWNVAPDIIHSSSRRTSSGGSPPSPLRALSSSLNATVSV